MMKLLLKSGADPNLCGAGNVSPLDAAILDKDVPIVKLLVEAGADPDLCSRGHVSPRRLAEVGGNREIIEALPPKKKETGMKEEHAQPDRINEIKKGQSDARDRVSP